MKTRFVVYGVIVVSVCGGVFYVRTIPDVPHTSGVKEARPRAAVGDLTPARRQSVQQTWSAKDPRAFAEFTEMEEGQAEEQRLLDEQREQATPDDQSTEPDQRQAEERRLLEEQGVSAPSRSPM